MDLLINQMIIKNNRIVQELPLMESFYTIQGEGFHQGKAAYFIRLAGCDVGCPWCDVKESWNKDQYGLRSVSQIVKDANQHTARIAVITGGEPTMYQLDELTATLHSEGFQTHIETSGCYPLTGSWNWICLSPKKFKPPLPAILPEADELKIIIYNKSDFRWAEKYAAMVRPDCKLYLQPEWSRSDSVISLIVDYIKEHPEWELSLQIHKYIHVP
jgi:7-carboxy-7-deazaguanine synthase